MKRLSLTFDNGPTAGITDPVLDVLQNFGVCATFFLVGTQLAKPGARKIAERALRLGHRLGNHSYHHGPPLGLQTEPGVGSQEILDMHHLMGDLTGPNPLYRPNGRGSMGPHLFSSEAVTTLSSIGATIVLWTSVPRDRKVVVDSPNLWVEDAKSDTFKCDWPVIVLHDRPSGFDAPGPMAFLSEFLRWAVDKVEFRQDFPTKCTPMISGEATSELKDFVTEI
jgi:peptidoglycan/xylan/chitin deacetylase (PgdA/CDA1 family)